MQKYIVRNIEFLSNKNSCLLKSYFYGKVMNYSLCSEISVRYAEFSKLKLKIVHKRVFQVNFNTKHNGAPANQIAPRNF